MSDESLGAGSLQSKETACTKCGEKAIASRLCPRCYKHENRLLEIGSTKAVKCPLCGRYRIAGKWKHAEFEEVMEREIDRNLKVNAAATDLDLTLTRLHSPFIRIQLKARLGDEPWEAEVTRKFAIDRVPCDTCAKRTGGYHEACVQIRADDRTLEADELERIQSAIGELLKEDSILSSKEVRGGVDYSVAPLALAKQIEKRLKGMGANVLESFKHMGQDKEGRGVNQLNVVARFPAYRVGDIVKMGGAFYRVESIGKKTLLRDFQGDQKAANAPELVVPKEDVLEGMIVSVNSTVQFMDENYEMHDLGLPGVELEEGKRVKFIRIDDRVYPIWR